MILRTSLRASVLARAAVLGAVSAVLAYNLSVRLGLVAAFAGGAAGTILGRRLAGTRLRSSAAIALSCACAILVSAIADGLLLSVILAESFGTGPLYSASEIIRWLGLALLASGVIGFLEARRRALAIATVVAVGGVVTLSLAAHRDGLVNRPLWLADWSWLSGISPVQTLLAIGALTAVLAAVMLLSERRGRRVPLHLILLGVVAVALLYIVRLVGVPRPQAAGGVGVADKSSDQQGGDAGRSGARGSQAGRPGGLPSAQGDSQPGESLDELQFRNEYSRSGSEAPVAVVLLHGDYSPPGGIYYFRQTAFSQFNGLRLVQATRDDVDRDVLPRFPESSLTFRDAPPSSNQRVDLRTTVGLVSDHPKPFGLDAPAEIWPADNPDPLQFQRAYGVLSRVPVQPYEEMLGHRAGDAHWSDPQWDHYTDRPTDPRYETLAREIQQLLKPEYRNDPLAEAFAVKMWLDRNGIYSRRSTHADASDPTASFLFGDRTGYCVHFAHAAVFLLRSLGLPARVAAGYAVPESDRAGGSSILIRGVNAHAWPEVRLEGVGWVVVDPAPERSLDQEPGPPDEELQRLMGEMLRRTPMQRQAQERGRVGLPAQVLARATGALLLMLLGVAYATKLYRTLVPIVARDRQVARVAYRAALDRLGEAGLIRGYGESREQFAARASVLAFAELTMHHLGAALGSRQRPMRRQIRGLCTAVGQAVRRRGPAWRWCLGMANPISWLWSR